MFGKALVKKGYREGQRAKYPVLTRRGAKQRETNTSFFKKNKVHANLAATKQTLFGADPATARKAKQALRGGGIQMTEQDHLNAAEVAKKGIDKLSTSRNEMDMKLAKGNVSTIERRQFELEKEAINKEISSYQDTFAKSMAGAYGEGSPQFRGLSNMERLGLAGSAVKEYMWGGTGKQIAARNGAVFGGIIGVNAGLDYLNNNSGNSGTY